MFEGVGISCVCVQGAVVCVNQLCVCGCRRHLCVRV